MAGLDLNPVCTKQVFSNTYVLLIGQGSKESQTFKGQVSLCVGLGAGKSSSCPPITLMSELVSSACGKGVWFLCITPQGVASQRLCNYYVYL